MSVDKKTLSWLTTVPASDINFRMRLKDANLETLHAALKKPGLSKTAVRMINAQIRRLNK